MTVLSHIRTLALLCVVAAPTEVLAAQQADSLSKRQVVTADSVKADSALLSKIKALQSSSARTVAAQAAIVARQTFLIDSISKATRSADTIRLRLQVLERQHEADAQATAVSVAFRMEVTRTILSEMNKGVVFITFTQNAIDLEQTDMLLKNIWSDKELTNAWDRLDLAGAFVGGATALLGSTKNGTARVNAVAVGAGVMGLTRLVGGLFGAGRATHVNEVVQRIALSRRAFDALKVRNEELKSYAGSNYAFRSRVQAARDSLDLARTRVDSLEVIAHVGPMLDEYAHITSQIPGYIESIIIVNSQHVKEFAALDSVLAPITRKAQTLQGQYKTEVLPVLTYANQLRTLLDPEVAKALDEAGRKKRAQGQPSGAP